MSQKRNITVLVLLITVISVATTSLGIFSHDGQGPYLYESIRGRVVEIYGLGIYKHMTSDVAIQGIAQDYVTLGLGVPLLLISLVGYRKGSMKSYFILTGTLAYFFVTFLFYTAMAMYNVMFLCYVALLSFSFFCLVSLLLSSNTSTITAHFFNKTPTSFIGGFLIFTAISIAFLWLGIVVPPLANGTVYPEALEHYTTLIVQAFDLALLLPMAVISGWLLIQKKPLGYLFSSTYIIFLSLLMTALTAKIVAMAMNGVNVVPVIFIIPTFNIMAIICSYLTIKNINNISDGVVLNLEKENI